MKRNALLAVLVMMTATSLWAQGAAPKPAIDKALVPFQGTWVLSLGDQTSAGAPEVTLVITGNTYAQTVSGQVQERGTFKVDAAKKPMTIDLTISEGGDAGKVQLGVVEITGDTMKGKFATAGASTRPSDFAPEEGAFIFSATRKK